MDWSHNYIYPWDKWTDYISKRVENFLDYTVTVGNVHVYGFLLFMFVGGPLVMLSKVFFLISLPFRVFEWAVMSIGDSITDTDIDDGSRLKFIVGLMIQVPIMLIILAILCTYGIGAFVNRILEDKRNKKQQQMERAEFVAETIRREWGRSSDAIDNERTKKDFKPKKEIKAHSLVKPPLVFRSPGIYITETDHSFISVDNAFGYIPNILTVEERAGRLNTTRTRRSRRGYFNNIGNE